MNCRHGNLTTFKNSPYLFTMNTIGAFQIPLFLVSVYCILKKSPWNMVFYKWLILVFQLAIISFNVLLTILCTPVVFYPYLCGYTIGLLSQINISTRSQYFISTFALGCVGASTTVLFEYRHQSVLPNFHILRHSTEYRVFKNTVYYVIAIFHVWLPIYFENVEDRESIEKIVDNWRNAPCDIWNENTVVFSVQKLGFLHFYYMGGIAIVIVLSTIYAVHSFYIIRATRILLSNEMQKVQRKFLKGLLLQVLVPYSVLVLPAGLGLFILLLTDTWDQMYVQPGLCLIATHGLLSTITTIMVHKPYRVFFFILCRRCLLMPAGVKVNTVDELTTLPNIRMIGIQTHVTKF
ncbi:Serpentine Receptor, class H [Caenorhabditis elegans]|uniref:Serpentine Receptor, class H n=1 Tax=Caenorhabditis elegans TaxID=6239 RepID=Q18834_CAEEL|nr:Serpentine Receptor, class H [Caenorhabditis elegans]CAA99806.4 Serpentine Receptor, class H [Caenorhabditis elegans]|eukprot:NP_506119.4 Serpentine Receptor, class H [Caenorhabditis elegans]